MGLLFGGTGALAGLGLILPTLAGYQQVLLAGLLLAVPSWVLRRTDTTIDDLGVALGPALRTLRLATITALIVFPPFIAGYHVLQTEFLDHEASWSVDSLKRWDEALERAPARPCVVPEASVLAWTDRRGLWLIPAPGSALEATLPKAPTTARAVRCGADGVPRATRVLRAGRTVVTPAAGEGIWLDLDDSDRLALKLTLNGHPLPAERLRLGRHRQAADDDGGLSGVRDLWWLPTFLLVHLGLVALPEEWFFRGYLQTRLDERMGTPRRLLGVQVGWGFVISAFAFAVLHPILIPGPHRLLVFFPALLFGYLRARGGNIGAAVVVHALANLVQAVVSRMYI